MKVTKLQPAITRILELGEQVANLLYTDDEYFRSFAGNHLIPEERKKRSEFLRALSKKPDELSSALLAAPKEAKTKTKQGLSLLNCSINLRILGDKLVRSIKETTDVLEGYKRIHELLKPIISN